MTLMIMTISIMILLRITRVPSCKLHDREIAHALPNQSRLRRFGECSSRLGHLVEFSMMSLHASEFRATAERFPRIFSFSCFLVFSFLVFSSSRLPVFSCFCFLIVSFSRFLVFSFSCFLVFSFSRLLVFSCSRFLVFSFSRSLVFSFSRLLVFSSSRFLVFSFSCEFALPGGS